MRQSCAHSLHARRIAGSPHRVASGVARRITRRQEAHAPPARPNFQPHPGLIGSSSERLDVRASPRSFTADVTPEQLASMLHDNGGRMAVLSAEGGVFDLMAGRYSAGVPNLDVYLAGHAGDPIRVDRRGRSAEAVDRPALTIGVAIQPCVLARIGRLRDLAGRGLLDRFLYALPAGTVGYRQTRTEPMPKAVSQRYDTSLRASDEHRHPVRPGTGGSRPPLTPIARIAGRELRPGTGSTSPFAAEATPRVWHRRGGQRWRGLGAP